jgi:hypothetical protein
MAASQQAADGPPVGDDQAMIYLWIAFNALYGRWDHQVRQPLPDMACYRGLIGKLLAIDHSAAVLSAAVSAAAVPSAVSGGGGGYFAGMYTAERKLVTEILEDEFLSHYFWQEPTPQRAGQSRKARHESRTWYLEGKWGVLSERVLERIYLMRCQLIHGAATHGGKLNRDSLARCVLMLRHVLQASILVLIQDGGKLDLGPLCYAPLHPGERA